jgi:phosphatidylserine decarboxylase
MFKHQYIDRSTQQPRDEVLYGDKIVNALYSPLTERVELLTRIASSEWLSNTLALISHDTLLRTKSNGITNFVRRAGVDLSESVEEIPELNTAEKLFQRQIRYWECRPLPENAASVVCPTDSRVIVGSLNEATSLFIKDKFFTLDELLGVDRKEWIDRFTGGDFAIFRLTPEKYHYVHVPAAGAVIDHYELAGRFHSCNPGATVFLITPYSKNRRIVTILDTDVDGGDGVGIIAVIEVVALMVGQVVQCYSEEQYYSPRTVECGMFLKKGQPKSVFRPGSSTVILLFEPDRVCFADDLLTNRFRQDVSSRFSLGFNQPIVETDVLVRSLLGQHA